MEKNTITKRIVDKLSRRRHKGFSRLTSDVCLLSSDVSYCFTIYDNLSKLNILFKLFLIFSERRRFIPCSFLQKKLKAIVRIRSWTRWRTWCWCRCNFLGSSQGWRGWVSDPRWPWLYGQSRRQRRWSWSTGERFRNKRRGSWLTSNWDRIGLNPSIRRRLHCHNRYRRPAFSNPVKCSRIGGYDNTERLK